MTLVSLLRINGYPVWQCEKAEGARDRAPESVPLKSLRRGSAEPWSNTVKLSPERWAAIAASIPGFIMFYTNKAPATAAEFEATGAVGAQTPP